MRTHGTLTRWNDERGFGFITPAQGSGEIFVHISTFPRDGKRPVLNELISFETETGSNGKTQAVRVMRPTQRQSSPIARQPFRTARRQPNRNNPFRRVSGGTAAFLIVAAVGAFAYSKFPGRASSAFGTSEAFRAHPVAPPSASFSCDGRTMCSQMTSCAEARYFLAHCPNTKMDGDNDGVPCERQWCN